MKRTPLKRKTALRSKTPPVTSYTPRGASQVIKTSKTTHRPKTQKDCDKLLSPIIKELYPECILCGAPTQVAHHHVHKSKSLALRYHMDNLINLCNGCHMKLHYNESYWASVIVKKRSMKWFDGLEREKNKIVKYFDYDAMYAKLSELLRELKNRN